jgi:hypothetical protein
MPIDERRRAEIAGAVATHNAAGRKPLLAPDATHLLTVMFPLGGRMPMQHVSPCGENGRQDESRRAITAYPDRCRVFIQRSGTAGRSQHLPPAPAAEAAMRLAARREKVFGPGRAVPLDRNQKARITAYAKAWDRLHRQPGRGRGAEPLEGPPWTS